MIKHHLVATPSSPPEKDLAHFSETFRGMTSLDDVTNDSVVTKLQERFPLVTRPFLPVAVGLAVVGVAAVSLLVTPV